MISLPMLSKEYREWFSTHRFMIVALVFTMLAVAQPISIKLLPDMLANNPDLPEGTIIQIPTPPVTEIMSQVIKKFDIMGFFVTVLILMNTIAGERQSGVAAMVLVKPINRGQYFFSKAVAYSSMVSLCFIIAMLATGYYTEIIFETAIDWAILTKATLCFLPNLLTIVSIGLFAATFLRSPVGVGGLAFGLTLVLNFVPPFLGNTLKNLSPRGLTEAAANLFTGTPANLSLPLLAALALSALFLLSGWQIFKRQEI